MGDVVLNGSLSAFELSNVLNFLNGSKKTGMLTLAHGSNEAYVFFRRGDLVYAASNQDALRLGSVLLRRKKITKEQSSLIDNSITARGKRFGEVAVEQGIMTSDELNAALKVQIAEVVYDAFMWNDGGFSFYDNFDLPPTAITISIDLPNLIMEGARRIEEYAQCLALLPDSSVVFRVVSSPETEKITLTLEEWKILFLINGQRTLEEICRDAGDDVIAVYRVVYGLSASNLIEPVHPSAADDDESKDVTTPVAPLFLTDHVPGDADETIRQSAAEFEATVRELRDRMSSDDRVLLISSDARLSYRDVVKQTVAQLTITTGEPAGAVFPLTNTEYTIGRHRDNSIRLIDVGVSGHHARLYRGPDGYVIEDLKSRNGVWINGNRTFHSVLKHGDRVQLGSTDMDYAVLFGD